MTESRPTERPHAGPLAVVVRGGLVESAHVGHLVVAGADGTPRVVVGDPDAVIWPRSAVKPLQAVALLLAGLEVDDEGLALACASHSGTDDHLAVVRRVLAGAGLTEADLQNTPDLPLDASAAFERRRSGHGAASVTQNCSGKHAAMLATCVRAGWPTASYRSPEHPLQSHVRATLEELTGVPVEAVTVDGCGAPLFSTTVRGLARAFGRIAAAAARPAGAPSARPADPVGAAGSGGAAAPDLEATLARVGRAMRARPDLVGGPGRDVTRFMQAWPGVVAKDGAEGVYAAGLPDGTGVAFKLADGSGRARPAVLAAALEVGLWSGAPADGSPDPATEAALHAVREVGRTPVLGHGVPVGEVYAVLGRADRDVEVGGRW